MKLGWDLCSKLENAANQVYTVCHVCHFPPLPLSTSPWVSPCDKIWLIRWICQSLSSWITLQKKTILALSWHAKPVLSEALLFFMACPPCNDNDAEIMLMHFTALPDIVKTCKNCDTPLAKPQLHITKACLFKYIENFTTKTQQVFR